ncbi:PKD domain-containing protein, partial [Cytophaga aurantiaca]|uniref:Ig-like domain-containing protein n=1 Tax=Cytophaga aurantiaca TaxID=29530 RepID=UPI001B7F8C3A
MKKENNLLKRLLIALGILLLINIIAIKASAQLTHSGNFIHLGAVEANEELAFVKQKIAANQEPWTSEFNELLTWAVAGNLANVGPGENGPRDLCKNAYANALAWHYTGNVIYANRAVAILNAWANNFTGYASTAGQDLLVGGWIGTLLGPTAELMRNYPGWTAADQAKMKAMFVARFYPVINTMSTWNGNVDLTQIQAMLAIAVYNEDVTEFNAGLARLEKRNPAYYYLSTDNPASRNYGGSNDAAWGSGSAVTAWVDGLTQETCRDNGHHAQFAMAATLAAAEIAWHQGVDVYAREEKRYVAVLELMAKQLTSGNMQGTCANNVTTADRYNTFEIGYNHYHNRVGLDMIETQKILNTSAASESSWNIFFETLTHRGTGSIISACTKPNLGTNQSICGKNSITLNTGLTANARTFVWYKDNIVITNATSPTLTITQAGTYKVDVDSLGCKNTSTIVISNTLTAIASAPYELCNPVQQTLDAGNAGGATVSYLWNTGAVTQSIVVSKAGSYTVTISAANCTPVSSTYTVTSKLLTVTSDTICAPGMVNLSVTGTSTYKWFDVATNGTALSSTKNYQPTITANKTFYVEDQGTVSTSVGKASAGTGASWTAGVADFTATDKIYNVTVLQAVTLNSIAVYVVNAGTSVTINLKQGAVTSYTKTVTGLAAGKQTIPLNFNLLPGTYVIDAVGTTSGLTFEASGGTFPYSYPNYLSFTYNQSWQSTWYGLFYDWKISVGNTCLRTPVFAIIDNTRPVCSGKPAVQNITGPISVTPNQQNVTYSVNPTVGSTFQWTLPAGATVVSTNTAKNQITVSFGTNGGNISVTETNASGSTTNTITITMSATCTATITSPTTSFCTGGSATLSANTGTGLTYQWSNAAGTIASATNATYTATAAGAYTVTVNNGSCSATSTPTTITVNALPTATINAPATSFCTGGSVILSANTGTGLTYQWSNATGTIASATNATYTATAAGTYTVKVTNNNSCSATSTGTTITVTASITWYQDLDGDGKGDPSVTTSSCTQPTGYVSVAGDACPNDPAKIAAGNCGCGKSETSCLDCAGVPNGTAYLDNCSVCVGGTTGNTPCVTTATKNGTSINISVSPQPFQSSTTIKLENLGTIKSITIVSAAGALIDQRENINATEITLGES